MTLAKSHHKTTYHSCSTPKKDRSIYSTWERPILQKIKAVIVQFERFLKNILGIILARSVVNSVVHNNTKMGDTLNSYRHFEKQIKLPTYFALFLRSCILLFSSIMHQLTFSPLLNFFNV